MILYLDASALVKLFLVEEGSAETSHLVTQAQVSGTAVIGRAEVAAALARAARMQWITRAGAEAALTSFRSQWARLFRLPVTETMVTRAEILAWEQSLRGYDAVHLAAALSWQDALGQPVTLATFDQELWHAGRRVGITVWPEEAGIG